MMYYFNTSLPKEMSYSNETIQIFYTWLQKEGTDYSIFANVFYKLSAPWR